MHTNIHLEVRHLRLLTAIAERGSLTDAARYLHLTQSALSHQLRDAEERMGARLFLRLGKKMVLTPGGTHLLQVAKKVLEELSRAQEQVNSLNGKGGVIRLSTECYTCYHWLPGLMKRFQLKFPNVTVSIDAASTHNPLQALLAGNLDVAIVSQLPSNVKGLAITPICEDEMVMVLPPGHRLCKRKFIQPSELDGEILLIYPPREESTLLQKYVLPTGAQPKEVLEIPLTEAMIEMVAAGMGVTLLAVWALGSSAKSKRVVVRPLTGRGVRRTWYAVTLGDQQPSPHIAEFVDLLAEPCADGLWPGTRKLTL